jgi:hypothetical protein
MGQRKSRVTGDMKILFYQTGKILPKDKEKVKGRPKIVK